MAALAAKNYCDAIFAIAQEDQKTDLYKEQLKMVDETMQNEDVYPIICHPKISREEKKALLDSVYGSNIDVVLLNFLKLLIDKRHFQSLHDIVKEYNKSYNAVNNIQVVYVKSAKILDHDDVKRLQKTLETKLDMHVDMRLQVDEDLIAGIRVKIGDMLIDNSAAAKLDTMRKQATLTKL